MARRRLLFLLMAVIVAVSAAQLVRGISRPPASAPAVPAEVAATRRVLVAAADLPAGLLVQPDHLRWQPWPDASADGYIAEGSQTLEAFAGAVVRQGLRAGEPIVAGRLAKPGERGFLSAVLNPDMRGVSVPVTAVTGIAGFVFPGDRVDVILTHSFARPDDPERQDRRAAETVLTDVRVLAIDQRTSDQDDKPATAKIVTLEVTPRQAEMLPLVVELGQLSLSLRSLGRGDAVAETGRTAETAARATADGEARLIPAVLSGAPAGPLQTPPAPVVPRPRSYTWDSDVSALLPKPGDKDAETRKVQVLRGKEASQVEFPRSR